MHPRIVASLLALLPSAALCQSVTSQYELNGFLLGQHVKAIEAQLGQPSQTQETSDRWSYKIYIIDRPHRGYMVFKFAPDRPEYAFSIQVAGDSAGDMYPFLGLVLGSDTTAARMRLGAPTTVERETDPPLLLWSYQGRNYSLEFTPAGKLYSVQLFGYDGFPKMPSEPLAPIAPLRDALLHRDVERLLALMAPDFEVYQAGRTHTFAASARKEIADATTTVAQLLYAGRNSLRDVLADSALVDRADVNIRVYEHPRPGAIYTSYRFPKDAPLNEIVFEGYAGQWRVWEIRFR
jgi:hypothetical protein